MPSWVPGTSGGELRHAASYRRFVLEPVAVYEDGAANCSSSIASVAGPIVGHCTLAPGQHLTALAAVKEWLDTGVRPDPAFFPVEKGFNP